MENNNLGDLVEQLYELKLQKEALKEQLSTIEKDIDAKEFKVLKLMEESNLNKMSTSVATVTRKVELYPQVKDIDALVNWAYENGRADILQRRVSKSVFDEMYEQTGAYPDGIDTYNKETLLFRKRG